MEDPGGGAPENEGEDCQEKPAVDLDSHPEQELEDKEGRDYQDYGIDQGIYWIEPAVLEDRVEEIILDKGHEKT